MQPVVGTNQIDRCRFDRLLAESRNRTDWWQPPADQQRHATAAAPVVGLRRRTLVTMAAQWRVRVRVICVLVHEYSTTAAVEFAWFLLRVLKVCHPPRLNPFRTAVPFWGQTT